MKTLQPVRGTKDILPEQYRAFLACIERAREVATCYGFEEVATPLFEFTEVFKRTLGETSDVVAKEMYSFEDRGGESITLRPEFTAGLMRAFISNGLAQQVPVKWFATGPLFRYERPQKGRQRQFHQLNFELIGAATPQADIEMIMLAAQLADVFGITNTLTLEINSLADPASREAHKKALVSYLTRHKQHLSEDSVTRLAINPLRILDSKHEGDQAIVADAPALQEFYSTDSKVFFDEVMAGLEALQIRYRHNPRLVRGLDYYSHTVFEFTTDKLGAQNAVFAGGRYDGLVAMMGGQATPAVGFAGGLERLTLLSTLTTEKERPVVIVPVDASIQQASLALVQYLRQAGLVIDMGYSGNVSKRLKRAHKEHAIAAIIVGEEEVSSEQYTVKLLDAGSSETVAKEALVKYLQSLY